LGTPTSRCPLCASITSREVFSLLRPRTVAATGRPTEELYGRAGPLVRCRVCGLVRQDPPAHAPYADASDPDYLNELDGLRETFRRTLATIERFRLPPGRLLDVGAGPGVLVEEAAERGWDALGVELSAWAVAEAQRRGVDVRKVALEDLGAEPGSFDAATLADVIEHVPDPLGTMRALHVLMKPGGVVFLATPNVDSVVAKTLRRWWWSVLPGHIWLFSRDTLTRLVREAGFEVVDVATHPKTFSVDYYAGRLVGYSGALGRAARVIVRRFAAGRLISPDFRDRVALVARKPS
jgi:2-polyprenyl-3-methyl-5-hydroxy-6-metoxy-1,4-benzoquinol methylase